MTTQRAISTVRYLPTVHRLRDYDQGRPLEALLRVIDDQVELVSQNIGELYEDWFIETCRPQLVPYLGELVSGSVDANLAPADGEGEMNAASFRSVSPRREAADAVFLQRRKGTLPVLEELTRRITRWPSRTAEWFPGTAQFQDLRRPHPEFGQTVDFRDFGSPDELERPGGQGAYFTDLKPSGPDFYPKNSQLVRLHLWRLQAFRITQGRPRCIWSRMIGDKTIRVFTLDAIGACRPLAVNPESEALETDLAGDIHVPQPLTLKLLKNDKDRASEDYYGPEKSLGIWLERVIEENDEKKLRLDFIPARFVLPTDLSWIFKDGHKTDCGCAGRPPEKVEGEHESPAAATGQDELLALENLDPRLENLSQFDSRGSVDSVIAVDPRLGLIALVAEGELFTRGEAGLRATHHYLFSAELGGGEYPRPDRGSGYDTRAAVHRLRRDRGENANDEKGNQDEKGNRNDILSLLPKDAIVRNGGTYCVPADTHLLVELTDSDTYRLPQSTIFIPSNSILEIRAAKKRAPALELQGNACDSGLTIATAPGAKFVLDGIRLFGGRLAFRLPDEKEQCDVPPNERSGCKCALPPVTDPTTRIVLRHCTLNPGRSHGEACCAGGAPVEIKFAIPEGLLTIDHCITSRIAGAEPKNPERLLIRDSIVDGQATQQPAIDGPKELILRIERSTVLGKTHVREIDLAQDSIFSRKVIVKRQQPGGMRFCWVPPNSEEPQPTWRTPQQFYCQPSQTYERDNPEFGVCAQRTQNGPYNDSWRQLRLAFTSCEYAQPGYCQLRTLPRAAAGEGPHRETCACSTAGVCSPEIARGAESGSEMGVFHDLLQPQHEDNLRRRVDEYTPLPMATELIFEN